MGSDVIAGPDDGIAEFDYQLLNAAGSRILTACFYSTNADFASSGGSSTV